MSHSVFKDLTIAERAMLEAGAYAAKCKASDPLVAPEHLRGCIEGLAFEYGKLVGHGKAFDMLAKIALKEHTFNLCDQKTKADALQRAPVTPPVNEMEFQRDCPGDHPVRRKGFAKIINFGRW